MKKGQKMTPEQLERHRLARLGKHLSPEALASRKQKLASHPSPLRGRKMSDEARHKMSLAKKGKPSKLRGRKRPQHVIDALRKANIGRPSWNSGKKMSPEFCQLMSDIRIGKPTGRKPMLGKHHSEESKAKMSDAHKGNKNSLGVRPGEETREKMRQNMLGNQNLLGHVHSDETKAKMSVKSKGRKHTPEDLAKMSLALSGAANPRWRGGRGRVRYGPGWKKAQREARKRDNDTCVVCGEKNYNWETKAIDVHHVIKVFACRNQGLEPHLPENLICLCYKHHQKSDIDDSSIPYLQSLLTERYGYQYYQGLPSQITSL